MSFWKNLAKVATYPIVHPLRTIKKGVQAVKFSAVAVPAGYIGWEKLTTDKSIARIAGETLVGKRVVDKAVNVAGDLDTLRENAGTAIDKVNNTLSDVDGSWGGMKKFFDGLFSGNGGNMLGDFFSNLGSGKVSGLSIAGLVSAALLIFGRCGWFGKVAGALLGMFVIGNNFDYKQVFGQGNTKTTGQETPYFKASAYSPKDDPQRVFIKAWDKTGKDYPAIELSRKQYESLIREGYAPVQIYHGMTQMRQEPENKGNIIAR